MEAQPGKPADDKRQADPQGGDGDGENPLSGAVAASKEVKRFALFVLGGGFLYCLLIAGLAGLSHNLPFKADDANFALFAGFIVVAGAIERIIQPLTAVLPSFAGEDTPEAKANRTLVAYGIALIIGIGVSSCFGLYFLEAIGVKIGVVEGSGEAAKWVFGNDGDKLLRGVDIFFTALIITGGTKPLHDMITSIEKKKDTLKKGAAGADAL